MTEAIAILSLAVAIVALRVAVRARRDLVEYGTALDAGVIAGMRRDHFNLAHAFTETRKLVDVQDAELNAAQDAIEALRKSVGTHPAGASNAVNLHDLVQMLARRADDQSRSLADAHKRITDALDGRLRAIEASIAQKKPPAKKRAK